MIALLRLLLDVLHGIRYFILVHIRVVRASIDRRVDLCKRQGERLMVAATLLHMVLCVAADGDSRTADIADAYLIVADIIAAGLSHIAARLDRVAPGLDHCVVAAT